MLDGRFPFLIAPTAIAGLDASDRVALGRFTGEVAERTGAGVAYDLRDGSLFYFIRTVTQGLNLPPMLTQFRMTTGFDFGLLRRIDDVCRMILRGRMATALKRMLEVAAVRRAAAEREQMRLLRLADIEYQVRHIRPAVRRSLSTVRGYREFLTGRAGQ